MDFGSILGSILSPKIDEKRDRFQDRFLNGLKRRLRSLTGGVRTPSPSLRIPKGIQTGLQDCSPVVQRTRNLEQGLVLWILHAVWPAARRFFRKLCGKWSHICLTNHQHYQTNIWKTVQICPKIDQTVVLEGGLGEVFWSSWGAIRAQGGPQIGF